MRFTKSLLRASGIDANVGWTLVGRLSNMVIGFAAIFPVTLFLTPNEQGYYYTFASVIALQVLFELGLTQILVQVTSHEFPFLPEDLPNALAEGDRHAQRLAYFATFAKKWYLVTSVIFATSLIVLGSLYFRNFGQIGVQRWGPPWVCLILLTAVNLYLSPRLAFVEGAGYPGKIAALRLSQTLIGYTLLIGVLWAGLALWAVVALPLTQVVLNLRWLARDRTVPNFFHRNFGTADRDPAWRDEILNLQWRVALSWVGGYLATLTFTPLLFAYQGAIAAGRWGLTFSILSQVSALGASWTTARAPRFGELIARGDRALLDREFGAAAAKTVSLVAAACVALALVVAVAEWQGFAIARRVAAIPDLVMMAIATVGSTTIFCLATYVRAHKEEPLAASSLVIGSITTLAAWIGANYGVFYVAAAYMLVTMAVNLPWRYFIFRAYVNRSPDPAKR